MPKYILMTEEDSDMSQEIGHAAKLSYVLFSFNYRFMSK